MLPPRRRFTSREKRRNAEVEWLRSAWPASTVSERCTSLKEHDEEMRWLAKLFPLEEVVDGSIPDELADSVLGE